VWGTGTGRPNIYGYNNGLLSSIGFQLNGSSTATMVIAVGGVTLNDTTTIAGPLSASASVGTSGQVLTSQGAGLAPQWTTASGGGTPAGSDMQVQYNSSGALAASANFIYDYAANQLTLKDPTYSPNFITLSYPTPGGVGQLSSGPGGLKLNGANLSSIQLSGNIDINGNLININLTGTTYAFAANGSLSVGGSAGTSGQVLTSTGPSTPPAWSTPSAGSGSPSTLVVQLQSAATFSPNGTNATWDPSATNTLSAGQTSTDCSWNNLSMQVNVTNAGWYQVTLMTKANQTAGAPNYLNQYEGNYGTSIVESLFGNTFYPFEASLSTAQTTQLMWTDVYTLYVAASGTITPTVQVTNTNMGPSGVQYTMIVTVRKITP
jgi:hypothetical protein